MQAAAVEGARAGLTEDAVTGPEARDGWSDARDGAGDVVGEDVGRFVAGEEALVADFFAMRVYWAWVDDWGEAGIGFDGKREGRGTYIQRWLLWLGFRSLVVR